MLVQTTRGCDLGDVTGLADPPCTATSVTGAGHKPILCYNLRGVTRKVVSVAYCAVLDCPSQGGWDNIPRHGAETKNIY